MLPIDCSNVGVGTFKKLMSALVDSTMLYGVEAVEQVQLSALSIFFGAGTLHSKASLMTEVESLPKVKEARVEVRTLLVQGSDE